MPKEKHFFFDFSRIYRRFSIDSMMKDMLRDSNTDEATVSSKDAPWVRKSDMNYGRRLDFMKGLRGYGGDLRKGSCRNLNRTERASSRVWRVQISRSKTSE